MTVEYYPLQVLLLALSGWVNREQQRTIEYLVEENRILKESSSKAEGCASMTISADGSPQKASV